MKARFDLLTASQAGVLVVLLSLAMSGCQVRVPTTEEAAPSPTEKTITPADVKVPLLTGEGGEVSLADYKGSVVMVDFWATWCAPCRYEIPSLNRMYSELADRDFVLIGMSVDHGEQSNISAAVQSLNVTYPTAWAGQSMQDAFGGIRAVPTKFLLDKQGAIRKRYVGVVPESQMRTDIAALLAE